MGRKPTIVDVAREASVSQGTASDALRSSDRVIPETRDRVQRAAEKLGYRANRVAQGLRTGKTGLVALALPVAAETEMLAHDYYATLMLGAARAAVKEGLSLILVPDLGGTAGAPEVAEGVIVADPTRRDPALKEIREAGTPVVTIGSDPSLADDPWAVIADNEGNCRMILDRLRETGAKRIALISCDAPWGWFIRNQEAYREWIGTAGFEPVLVSVGTSDRNGARAALADLLAGEEPPDAVLSLTEDSALGSLDAVLDYGLKVPDDFQVVSLVEGLRVREVRPTITALDLNPIAQAEAAVDLLLARIRGENPPGRVTVEARLIERSSTRK